MFLIDVEETFQPTPFKLPPRVKKPSGRLIYYILAVQTQLANSERMMPAPSKMTLKRKSIDKKEEMSNTDPTSTTGTKEANNM